MNSPRMVWYTRQIEECAQEYLHREHPSCAPVRVGKLAPYEGEARESLKRSIVKHLSPTLEMRVSLLQFLPFITRDLETEAPCSDPCLGTLYELLSNLSCEYQDAYQRRTQGNPEPLPRCWGVLPHGVAYWLTFDFSSISSDQVSMAQVTCLKQLRDLAQPYAPEVALLKSVPGTRFKVK